MHNFSSKTLGALLLTTLLVVAACGGSTATTPAVGMTGNPTSGGAGPTSNPLVSGSDLGLNGAEAAFANITSYKFSMTLAGGTFGSSLSALGGGAGASGDAAFTMTGTIVEGANPAADITMGSMHEIEVGGFDYIDMGTGSFIKTATTAGSGLASSFSPSTMFSSMVDASTYDGYTKVGSETKNGVMTDHYQANQTILGQYGTMAGVTGATWSADVWVAQNGGYPVSMNITAKAADSSVAYQVLFDITNVNDSSNSVTAPTNVTSY